MASSAPLDYLRSEGLDRFLNFNPTAAGEFGPVPHLLAVIHRAVRARKSFTVVEFGVGHSTVVIADALRKNQADWQALPAPPPVRNRFMFHCFTVDASKKWLDFSKENFPAELLPFVTFHHSAVKIGTHNGQLCHFYETLPDVVPDFIYLDGPDPKDVEGSINGLSFQCKERTVMAADPLLMESTFLPGFFMLVDGRTNNVRFLQRNFTRNYKLEWDREADVSTFELDEERLGKLNVLASDVIGAG
jgi:hypothetical protein